MWARKLLDRVGLGEAGVDVRFGWSITLAACALYAISFLVFYPDAITNDDEAAYLRHSRIILEGTATMVKLNALTGETEDWVVSRYPVGTAALMAPFVAVAGWRGAFVVPFLCLMGGVLVLGRWLQREGHSPLWALLALSYPPALMMGRVAMSDIPSFAVVTLGLWLFWRGLDRSWGYWMASGFVAGISTLWREPNAVIFVPFFAGTVLRREKACWAIVVGGLLGLGVRLLASTIVFGEPFFYKAPYKFDLSALPERLPTYLLTVLLLMPGGLLLVQFYRGRRWPELVASVNLFVLFYLLQEYFMSTTSPLRRVILTARYMFPLLPLMALAAADVLPRLWRRLREWTPTPRRQTLEAVVAGVLALWIGGVAVAAVAVHPIYGAWSSTLGRIRDEIARHTDPEGVIVSHVELTRKYINEIDRKYLLVSRDLVSLDEAMGLAKRVGSFQIVLLDRSDSPWGIEQVGLNAEFMASLEPMKPILLFDREVSDTERLRIWRVDPPQSP